MAQISQLENYNNHQILFSKAVISIPKADTDHMYAMLTLISAFQKKAFHGCFNLRTDSFLTRLAFPFFFVHVH